MKKTLKQLLGLLLTLAVLAGALYGTAKLLKRPDSDEKYHDFFQETKDYDVLLMGNSHMLNGVFPMQLWKDYGITSYNFGGHGATMGVSYWVLRNAVEYHKPKMVVLDVYGAIWDNNTKMEVEKAHLSFDAFPLSLTKVQGLRELFSGGELTELLFPFSVYHNRWSEITLDGLKSLWNGDKNNLAKGADPRVGVAVPDPYDTIPQEQMCEEETTEMQDLRRFISYCKDNDMELVLMYIPAPLEAKWQERCNYIQKIADEMEVPYLNLPYSQIIDYDTDMYDSHSHVNPAGAQKVTRALGEYLTEHYDLEDKRENAEYQKWNEDYEIYSQKVIKRRLQGTKDLKCLLMLQQMDGFSAEISVAPGAELDSVEEALLRKSGAQITENAELENGVQIRIRMFEEGQTEPFCERSYRKNQETWELV